MPSVGLFKAKVLGIAAGTAALINSCNRKGFRRICRSPCGFPRGLTKEARAKLLQEGSEPTVGCSRSSFKLLGLTGKKSLKLNNVDLHQLTISPALGRGLVRRRGD
jgi:hypothetical protein